MEEPIRFEPQDKMPPEFEKNVWVIREQVPDPNDQKLTAELEAGTLPHSKPQADRESLLWKTRKGPARYRVKQNPAKEGGFAKIHEAWDSQTHHRVAVKMISDYSLEKRQINLEALEKEAKVIARLNLPGVVKIYDLAGLPDPGGVAIIMEWMDPETSPTLEERLQKGPLSFEEVVKINSETAVTVDALAKKGIVHRDLKPGNIFLDPQFTKITDFGNASGVIETGGHALIGTPQYACPESWLDQQITLKSEIYALGTTTFEMLTGQVPFLSENPIETLRMISDPNRLPPRLADFQ
jgi:serine/threonine protein kinase